MNSQRHAFLKALSASTLFLIASVLTTAFAATATNYVSLSGSHTAPFTSWTTAATNIQAAVEAAANGNLVLITNGTYYSSGQATNLLPIYSNSMVVITKAIEVRSVNGPSVTFVNAKSPVGQHRGFCLDNADAVLDGLTITNGYDPGNPGLDNHAYGGGVYLRNGTVRNCIIKDNQSVPVSNNRWGFGGGIYILKGTVEGCTISSNYTCGPPASTEVGGKGGGIYNLEGSIKNCVIMGNHAVGHGGGIYMNKSSTITDNCLIVGNHADQFGGGGYIENGTVRHCTLVNNKIGFYGTAYQSRSEGAGIYMTGGSVANSILYHNDTSPYPYKRKNLYKTGGTITYSCVFPGASGTGNISGEPLFADLSSGDYHLAPGSPCIDAGINSVVTTDLEGNTRPKDGRGTGIAIPDIGAYEADSADAGVFRCGFVAQPAGGADSVNAVFSAFVAGENTNQLYYKWDFDADGNADMEGANLSVVTNLYSSYGFHSVRLEVSNQPGTTADLLRDSYIVVAPTQTFVSTQGGNTFPYNSWETAARSIQNAIDSVWVSSDNIPEVLVSNGIYGVTEPIYLSQNVYVRSLFGAENTIVERVSGNFNVISVEAPGAIVEGLTIRGGHMNTTFPMENNNRYGGGVYLTAGTLQHCIISENRVTGGNNRTGHGGGVFASGGLLFDCMIVSNTAYGGNQGRGGGIYATGGIVSNCTIANNIAHHSGGGLQMSSSVNARSCLIVSNRTEQTNMVPIGGGGVYCAGGSLENCTLVGNTAAGYGGGLYGSNAIALNTILWDNVADLAGANWQTNGANMFFTNSCSAPTANMAGSGNIEGDPLFVNQAESNFRLQGGSPCVNSGVNQDWMEGASDLDGNIRIFRVTVDIGCYERATIGAILSVK